MILACNHIEKSFGVDEILKDVSFTLEDNDKAAIIGINGAGKSTLLKIITGELSRDGGDITLAKDKVIGYLSQNAEFNSDDTIYTVVESAKKDLIQKEKELKNLEHQMSVVSTEQMDDLLNRYHKLNEEFEDAGGYTYKGEIVGVIRGLGFEDDDFDKKMSTLSGGQKTRVGLARLLVSKPDLLLLDEPTNHLDIPSIEWLEAYLKSYKGAVLIVSHDRFFLDKIVNKVVEIENKKSLVYQGTYTEFSKKKEAQRANYLKHYFEQQAMIKHEEEVIKTIRGFKTEAAMIRAKSREKRLDMVERLEKPLEIRADMRFSIEPSVESGKDVLYVENLKKAFPDKILFNDLQCDIKKGERVAIIGANGTGKTSFLKILNGIYDYDGGEYKFGTKVHVGYYDQEQALMDEENTLFDEILDSYPDLTNTKIRNVLGAFLFTNDDVFKKIKDLSGGERGRVSLAKLMLSEANFLILDEPTNHLDINSKEILETALNNYSGTVLFVSHDRYFINRTATRIMELTSDGFINYLGDYDYYLEKAAERKTSNTPAVNIIKEDKKGVVDWNKQKEEAKERRKLENRLNKVEDSIADFEDKIKNTEEKLMDPSIAANSAKLNEYTKILNELKEQLEPLYSEWEDLTNNL